MITFDDLFETLRRQAETDTADAGTDKRRPSWAPALVLGDEILTALADLNHPLPDKKVARLWATFAGGDKPTSYLRINVSALPMPEARVRDFELRLGTERSGLRLLQAKRHASGSWSINAHVSSRFARWREHKQALRNYPGSCRQLNWLRDMIRSGVRTEDDWVLRDIAKHEAALAKHAELEAARADYDRRRKALSEPIKQRVAEFAGDPLAQMIAGAHVTGNCCICGRHLSDSLSLERGIGPECYSHIAPALRDFVERRGSTHGVTMSTQSEATPTWDAAE